MMTQPLPQHFASCSCSSAGHFCVTQINMSRGYSRGARSVVILILSLLLCVVASQPLYANDTQQRTDEVQDLRYGVVLYHFYQQSYFSALTEALVGEQKADMPYHGDSAKLLRGGMSLSYGMSHQAEKIFSQLLTTLGTEEQKNRAWFYLGKLFYSRGEYDAAKQALSQLNESSLARPVRDESIYLSASILRRNGEHDLADEIIQQLPRDSVWIAYYQFNKGAAQTVAGDWQQGVETFKSIKDLSAQHSEALLLKDRAAIASGFAYLGAKQWDQAIGDFKSVRLDSPLVERALLGYGWAHAQNEDYEKALAPWQALGKRSVFNAEVQESLLAIPFAYEKLEAQASALTQYVNAVDVYEQELANIKAAKAHYTNTPIEQIIGDKSDLGIDWISGNEFLPLDQQAPYLAQLIAQDHFQAAIADHQDLLRMARFIDQSNARFAALQDALSLQKQVWQRSLDNALREKYRQRYGALVSVEKKLQQTMRLAEKEQDGQRLIDDKDHELWLTAQQAQQRIEQLKQAGVDVSEQERALRLYRGLLAWQASEQFPIKQWELRKQLTEVSELVEDTRQKLKRVESLSADRLDSEFAGRMQSMRKRIDEQRAGVDRALMASQNSIRTLALTQLDEQQQRIGHYLGQAKMAIARLYDVGSGEAEE